MNNKLYTEEQACIDMVTSIIAYDYPNLDTTAVRIVEADLHSKDGYLRKYVDSLGLQKVIELTQNQLDLIDRIEVNTYQDSEGVPYNTIVWREHYIAA